MTSLIFAQRHHWQAALVGMIDAAWNLTEEEKFHTATIVGHLLDLLRIPERRLPAELPVEVVLEVEDGFFTRGLIPPEGVASVRPARRRGAGDDGPPTAVWRDTFIGLLLRAYPDLDALERLAAARWVDDLLAALGADDRAATWVPERVARSQTHPV